MTTSTRRPTSAFRTIALTVATTALVASSTVAMAQRYDQPRYDQPRYDQQRDDQSRYDQPRYDRHRQWGQDYGNNRHDWRRGEHMGRDDWNNSQRIDYRAHHLNRPPRGYEWRENNGRYVLAAIAGGAIMSIILESNRR